jgi:hypothetical protein
MKTIFLCLWCATVPISSSAAESAPDSQPSKAAMPTAEVMRRLAARVAEGDEAALNELHQKAQQLYAGLGAETPEGRKARIDSNYKVMRAATDLLGEEAAKGNAKAFEALKRALKLDPLSSFAPDGIGQAAAAGNAETLEILTNYEQSKLPLSTAIFAQQPAAKAQREPAIAFFIDVIRDPKKAGFAHQAAETLVPAAGADHAKALTALNEYGRRSLNLQAVMQRDQCDVITAIMTDSAERNNRASK